MVDPSIYVQQKYFFLHIGDPTGAAMLVPSTSSENSGTLLDYDVIDTCATYGDLVHEINATNCKTQNGSARGRFRHFHNHDF